MTRQLFCVVLLAIGVTAVFGQEPKKDDAPRPEIRRATYMIHGLHCPPCVRTVEGSIGRIKGVKRIQVDFKSKSAVLEYDEAAITAQELARAVADTPHMMGRRMSYSSSLVLKVAGLSDPAVARKAEQVLLKVEGVSKVAVWPKQDAVGIDFGAKGRLTSAQLIDALTQAELKAEPYIAAYADPPAGRK